VVSGAAIIVSSSSGSSHLPELLDNDDDNDEKAIFQSVGNHSLSDTASRPRRPESSATVL